MVIYLVGFMGCGKTTIGELLAFELSYRFIDMDNCIEKAEGESIFDIFQNKGEKYFRELERELLLKLSQEKNCVIATGGGAVCSDFGVEMMKSGISVYLKSSPKILTDRILESEIQRPLVIAKSETRLESYITELLAIREYYYNRADITVESMGLEVKDLSTKILKLHIL